MITAQDLESLAGASPDQVRRHVRSTLSSSKAYGQLAPAAQRSMAQNLTQALLYLTDPAAGQTELRPAARALEDKPPFGPAAQAAPGVMKGLVDTVDFVAFVSGLIKGVFQSIVDASIRQMQEFGKFLEAVVKSVEEFANDHITPLQARQNLAQRYPRALQVEDGKLAVKSDVEDKDKPDLKQALGTSEDVDLDSEEGEQKVVVAAQLQMARQRQQLLSTMMLMGMNRIIVTDGEIKASVVFDVTASDTRSSGHTGDYGDETTNTRNEQSTNSDDGGWFSSQSSTDNVQKTFTSVSTAHTHFEGKSDDQIKAHANLSGSVLVKFKSDVFPLEKLASSTEMTNMQDKSKR
jgi:hypothetical protein